MKNLTLICGGQSPEHEISIRSAKNILKALDRSKYKVTLIGISKSGKWILLDERDLEKGIPEEGDCILIKPGMKSCFVSKSQPLEVVDVIFPILHGPNGEDGSIQGLFQLLNIPYVGSDVLGSAIAMDKDIAKKILRQEGLTVADWILIRKGESIPSYEDVVSVLGEVVFVKPANMGSSVGVSRVSDKLTWGKAIEEALGYDDKILVESHVEGRELECAVKGNNKVLASGVGEVLSGEIYSYDQKYADDSSARTIIPAKVTPDELEKLRSCAIKAYKALECQGLSRVDSFLTVSGEVYINEINTMPGFTSISMYPSLWEEKGVSYTQLLDELIEFAIKRG